MKCPFDGEECSRTRVINEVMCAGVVYRASTGLEFELVPACIRMKRERRVEVEEIIWRPDHA